MQLGGNAVDSLFFRINSVSQDPALIGDVQISAQVMVLELNTGRELVATSDSLETLPTVNVLNPSTARMDGLIAYVKSDTLVNADSTFHVRALVSNLTGADGDTIEKATLEFDSFFNSIRFIQGDTLSVYDIAPGESKWTEPGLLVQAPEFPGSNEVIHAKIQEVIGKSGGEAADIQTSFSRSDTTVRIHSQAAGNLQIVDAYADKDSVGAGSWIAWNVHVALLNSGQGTIEIGPADSMGLDIVGEDGCLIEQQELNEDVRYLMAGETDTLVYSIKRTGFANGEKTARISILGHDMNARPGNSFVSTTDVPFVVYSNSAVQITRTYVDTALNVHGDTVHVNTGQTFNVKVTVNNAGGQDLSDVTVGLSTQNLQIIGDAERTLTNLSFGSQKDVEFTVQAPQTPSPDGEYAVARILSARGIDSYQAREG
ncbi:MAG: hypothetical protein U5R06_17380 [candidate division KSB1 bacterium]|nr:hypothetical protein [candidate division KSB1 bacterium]